jgi:hypothetical protein
MWWQRWDDPNSPPKRLLRRRYLPYWFPIFMYCKFTKKKFRYGQKKTQPALHLSKNDFWLFSPYHLLFLFWLLHRPRGARSVASHSSLDVIFKMLLSLQERSKYVLRYSVHRCFPSVFKVLSFYQFQYLCFVLLDCGTQSPMAPRYVRIGCQRSSYRQNSSFPSFVYCSLSLTSIRVIPPFCFMTHASLDSTVNDRDWPCFDLYKTPPNAVLLQSMLGCSVGLVLAHPSRV